MTERRYIYPAVFTREGGAYSVSFPDLEIATSGETLVEAMDMAQDALCLQLYDLEERKEAIPAASDIADLRCAPGSFASLIECDTMEYRRYYDSKAVTKTLSIPAWLKTMAEKEDINFSAVLQKALKEELNLA